MKAYRLENFGSIDGVVARERPIPEPAVGEALVQIHASSLNRRDLTVIKGKLVAPALLKTGLVPLSDGAGEVTAVGAGVTRFKPGDRVIGAFFDHWVAGRASRNRLSALGGDVDGTLAEYRAFPEEGLVPMPEHLSFEEAATLPCAAVTAWSAITGGPAPLQPGDWVLTEGSGGVSVFALQFAKLFGARVVALTSTQAKAKRLEQLGADATVLYSEHPDWDDKVRAITGGVAKAVDIGGPGTLLRSIKALEAQGHVAVVGFLDEGKPGANVLPVEILYPLYTLERVGVGNRTTFEAMLRAVAAHQLRPVIDRTFNFAEAVSAYRHMEANRHFGKIVIRHG